MTTISNVNVFDWNAYEKKLLASKNPTFTQTSTYMRAIGAIMLVGAAVLTQYARHYAFTPSILAYSAVVVISVVAIRILLNKSYKDLTVHDSVQRFKMHVEDMVSTRKGLLHSGYYQNQKDIIWAHIKNYEFTLSYAQIIERNGDIRNLLNPAELKDLGLKYLDGFTAKSLSTKFQEIYAGAKAFNVGHVFRAELIVLEYVTNYVNNYDFENSSREHYFFLCGESFISQSRSVLISDTSNLLVAAEGEMKKKISDRETQLSEDVINRRDFYDNKIEKLQQQKRSVRSDIQNLDRQRATIEPQLPEFKLAVAEENLTDSQNKLLEYEHDEQNPGELKQKLADKLSSDMKRTLPSYQSTVYHLGLKEMRELDYYIRILPTNIAEMRKYIELQQMKVKRLEEEVIASTPNDEVLVLKEQIAKASAQIDELNDQISQFEDNKAAELNKLKEESEKDLASYKADYKKTTATIIAAYKEQIKGLN